MPGVRTRGRGQWMILGRRQGPPGQRSGATALVTGQGPLVTGQGPLVTGRGRPTVRAYCRRSEPTVDGQSLLSTVRAPGQRSRTPGERSGARPRSCHVFYFTKFFNISIFEIPIQGS